MTHGTPRNDQEGASRATGSDPGGTAWVGVWKARSDAYSAPRVISDVATLAELPEGTVVLLANGAAAQAVRGAHPQAKDCWMLPGAWECFTAADLATQLPALLVWPQASEA
jgi:hypothetical protein